jgi:hypothetical protein
MNLFSAAAPLSLFVLALLGDPPPSLQARGKTYPHQICVAIEKNMESIPLRCKSMKMKDQSYGLLESSNRSYCRAAFLGSTEIRFSFRSVSNEIPDDREHAAQS